MSYEMVYDGNYGTGLYRVIGKETIWAFLRFEEPSPVDGNGQKTCYSFSIEYFETFEEAKGFLRGLDKAEKKTGGLFTYALATPDEIPKHKEFGS